MLKINLNELKQFKVFVYYSEDSEFVYSKNDYIPDHSYFCGFIEHIYAKDGKIVFRVYGGGYPSCEILNHTEFELDMRQIDVYENKIKKTYNIYDEYKDYEYMNIETSYESNSYDSRYISKSEIKLFKNLNFRFLMRRFYEVIPSTFICELESAMLMDEDVLSIVNIPEDYEFANY